MKLKSFVVCALVSPALWAQADLCASSITSSVTLTSDLSCPYNGLMIGADNVTIDCAGHTIAFYTSYGPGCYFDGCVYQGWAPYMGISVNALQLLGSGNPNQYQWGTSTWGGFTIKNCNIAGPNLGSDFAISVVNANGGTIENCTVAASNDGINISGSNNVTVRGSTVYPLYGGSSGISLYQSNNSTIAGNSIRAASIGIDVEQSSGNQITGNDFALSSGSEAGVFVRGGGNNLFEKNTIEGATRGVWHFLGNGNTFRENTFSGNGTAVVLSYASFDPICRIYPSFPECTPFNSTGNSYVLNDFRGNSVDVSNPGSATGNSFINDNFHGGSFSDPSSVYDHGYYSGVAPPAQDRDVASSPNVPTPFVLPAALQATPFIATGAATLSGNADIEGSAGINGLLTASGKAKIDGSVAAGAVKLSGGASVSQTAGSPGNATAPVDPAAVLSALANNANANIPAKFLKSQTLTLAGNDSLTLPAGNYLLAGIDLSGGATLNVSGGIFVTGSISLSGQSHLNLNGNPQDLKLFTASGASVRLTGGSSAAAELYAPGGEVTLSGQAFLQGLLYGETISLSGSAALLQ